MNYNQEAKSLTFRRGSEVSQVDSKQDAASAMESFGGQEEAGVKSQNRGDLR